MQKFHYHAGIAEAKFMGHIIIPAVMNELKQKTTGLEMNMTLCSGTTAEISYLDKEKREWRYPVDLEARTCSCRQWQITGLPCIHALFSSLLSQVQQGTFSSMCMITTLLQGSKPHMLMPCLLWRENNNGTWWTLDSSFALQF